MAALDTADDKYKYLMNCKHMKYIGHDGTSLKGRIDRLPFAAKWVQLH